MDAITHWSINSRAKVQHLIHAQEYIHWFYGIRECEMHKLRTQMDLEQQDKELKRLRRSLDQHQRKLNDWQQFFRGLGRMHSTEDIQDAISELEVGIERVRISRRDSQMQWDVASEEFDRIVNQHAEYLSLSYDDCQRILSVEALDRQHAMLIAGRALAARRQLPPDVGELLISLPPQKRERITGEALTLLNDVEVGAIALEAASILAHFPAETRKAALVNAARMLSGATEEVHA